MWDIRGLGLGMVKHLTANGVCEVIWCSGAAVTKTGGSGVGYTLGFKTRKNSWGKRTSETQGDEGDLDKSDRLATKWTACGSVRNQVVESRLAGLVRDVVRCKESDKCCDVFEANETFLKAGMELNGGIRGQHASATQRL